MRQIKVMSIFGTRPEAIKMAPLIKQLEKNERIKSGRVEAGLRTHNKYSPFPEKMNRQLVGNLADLHFAPTENSRANLLNESKNEKTIFVTGNTAIDALKATVMQDYKSEITDWINESKLILITAHRRENIGEPMRNIFKALKNILSENPDFKAIYPIHMNPVVRDIANEILEGVDNLKIIEPLEVVEFHNLIAKSYLILTDSGGIQEEAPSLGNPVLVLRDTTERLEGLKAGTLKLAGTNEKIIYDMISELITNQELYNNMAKANNPYGDGNAGTLITQEIINYFDNEEQKYV